MIRINRPGEIFRTIFIEIKATTIHKQHRICRYFPVNKKKSKEKVLFCEKKLVTAKSPLLERRLQRVRTSVFFGPASNVPLYFDCIWRHGGLMRCDDPPPVFDGLTGVESSIGSPRYICIDRHNGGVVNAVTPAYKNGLVYVSNEGQLFGPRLQALIGYMKGSLQGTMA